MTISIKQCILHYLASKPYAAASDYSRLNPIIVYSHEVETEMPDWVFRTLNIRHTPSSFARRWREIKSEASLYNLKIIEVTQKGDRESSWKIEFLNTPQVVSQDVAVQVHLQS